MILAALVLAQIVTATPAPKLAGGFGQPKPTIAHARVVISDEGVPRPAAAPVAAPALGAPTVSFGDDEAAWRGRYASLRAAVREAQGEYDRASAVNTVISWGDRRGYGYENAMAVRNAALTPYRTRLMSLRAELDSLPEECRRTAGCQPGWVR